ncbi:MAG TPA: CHAT domain-containing protein, partial [Thermoanaerobaculia bacterium]|nr:CHAT domain-containing protein [Thermoanaerobaculia bacterium]
IAPSASALTFTPPRATHSIATIEVPSTKDFAGLPAIESELADVASDYREHIAIPSSRATLASIRDAAARADVLHIAGHTEARPGLGDAALMLDEPVSWSTIAASPFHRACTVVLSACETLRTPRSPQSRALSLGGGFLAAGAADVIGTLTPITDEDARTIFGAFHKHFARGEDAASALRNAQLEAITNGRKTAWRAVALLTNRIPNRRTP